MPHCQKEKHDRGPKKKKEKKVKKAAACADEGPAADVDDVVDEAPAALPDPDERVDRDAKPNKKNEKGLFVCAYTKKRFKSHASFENHLRSKKYLKLRAADPEKGPAGAHIDAALATPVAFVPTTARDEDASDGDASDEDEWEDVGWEPVLTESLFDDHEALNFEANLAYMARAHSFRLPYRMYCINEAGLFAHLQEKVCRLHACLDCRMRFASREACLNHMADVSHRRANFDENQGARELAAFYDFAGRSPFRKMYTGGAEIGSDLILANGVVLGPRAFKRYYKQNHRIADARLVVRLNLRSADTRLRRHLDCIIGNKKDGGGMRRHRALLAGMGRHGNAKALAAQFCHKQDHANNTRMRAIVHHWGAGGGGSHYNMAGCKKVLRGQREKGLVSRHSKQAAVRNGKKSGKSGAKRSSSTAILM